MLRGNKPLFIKRGHDRERPPMTSSNEWLKEPTTVRREQDGTEIEMAFCYVRAQRRDAN